LKKSELELTCGVFIFYSLLGVMQVIDTGDVIVDAILDKAVVAVDDGQSLAPGARRGRKQKHGAVRVPDAVSFLDESNHFFAVAIMAVNYALLA
jgi:hypothetical protein